MRARSKTSLILSCGATHKPGQGIWEDDKLFWTIWFEVPVKNQDGNEP